MVIASRMFVTRREYWLLSAVPKECRALCSLCSRVLYRVPFGRCCAGDCGRRLWRCTEPARPERNHAAARCETAVPFANMGGTACMPLTGADTAHGNVAVLCQVTAMLTILARGGDFVCKMFDMHDAFTLSIYYICHKLFDRFV